MSNKQDKKKLVGTPEVINTAEVLALSTDEFLNKLGTSTSGLSTEEAAKRLEIYGTNELARRKNVPVSSNFYCISAARLRSS